MWGWGPRVWGEGLWERAVFVWGSLGVGWALWGGHQRTEDDVGKGRGGPMGAPGVCPPPDPPPTPPSINVSFCLNASGRHIPGPIGE